MYVYIQMYDEYVWMRKNLCCRCCVCVRWFSWKTGGECASEMPLIWANRRKSERNNLCISVWQISNDNEKFPVKKEKERKKHYVHTTPVEWCSAASRFFFFHTFILRPMHTYAIFVQAKQRQIILHTHVAVRCVALQFSSAYCSAPTWKKFVRIHIGLQM